MFYPAFLLISPLLSAAPALAAPKAIQLKAQEEVQVLCAPGPTIVVTTTVVKYLPAQNTAEAAQPAAAVERLGPDGKPDNRKGPQGGQTAAVVPTAAPVSQNTPTRKPDTNNQTPQGSSGPANIPNFNVTAEGTPPSSYRNALYFTNWYVSTVPFPLLLLFAYSNLT